MKLSKRVLIMGLPGSGKTTLASKVKEGLNADWINADKVRKKFNDWDFSYEGIKRQAIRMRKLANCSINEIVVADFVAPFPICIKIFKPHYLVWVDTINKSRFESMNKIFIKPKNFDLRVDSKDSDLWKIPIIDHFNKFRWNDQNLTTQMLGRFQPFHLGHKLLFYEMLKKNEQVLVMVKDVFKIGDNPFTFMEIKKKISNELKYFSNRFKIIKSPNISVISYGRDVGYKIKKINLPAPIQKISATKIRKKLRASGILNTHTK